MSGRVFHAPFISTNPHFELTAVTERSKELSREKYPDACIVRSFEELIGLEGLDLVVINTPDSTHYEYARRALEAGKHVVVEKPFTTTVAEAEELVALAASRGLTLSVYQNRRWDGDFLTVKEILSKGLLGHLVEFESTFPRYRNFIKPNTWKETGQDGGGLTYNLGAHVIDQAVQYARSRLCRYCHVAQGQQGRRLLHHSFATPLKGNRSKDNAEIQLSDVCERTPFRPPRQGRFLREIWFRPAGSRLERRRIARHSALGRGGQILLGDTSYGKGR